MSYFERKNGSTLLISFRIDESVVEHNSREFIVKKSDKYGEHTEGDTANPEKCLKLLPNHIDNLISE